MLPGGEQRAQEAALLAIPGARRMGWMASAAQGWDGAGADGPGGKATQSAAPTATHWEQGAPGSHTRVAVYLKAVTKDA